MSDLLNLTVGTGNQPDDFKAVVDRLASRGKAIGRLLGAAL